jgi:hypothetical protein
MMIERSSIVPGRCPIAASATPKPRTAAAHGLSPTVRIYGAIAMMPGIEHGAQILKEYLTAANSHASTRPGSLGLRRQVCRAPGWVKHIVHDPFE